MRLDPFAMERLQSTWEHRVAWNLSESGGEPLRREELADTAEARAALLAQPLGYTQTNGSGELRGLIAASYPGASAAHIPGTNGGSEANCIVLWHLIEPGDEAVVVVPNYMQAPGLLRALGATVRAWPLVGGETRWGPDLAALQTLVTDRTKVVFICTPNNPTGARLTGDELDAICRVAAASGAWVVSGG